MKKDNRKKRTAWIHLRHVAAQWLLRVLAGVYSRVVYRVRIRHYRDRRPCVVLMNHTTAFDQFFVALALRRNVYFVTSEDVLSNGWISRFLQWAVAPIAIKKSANDPRAVINCMRVVREGGSIVMAPEGNRTYSGRTGYIKPTVADLCYALKVPILLFSIEGGYGVFPRWSDKARRGRMMAGVSRVIEPEEYLAMSKEALYQQICTGLRVDEARDTAVFRSKRGAEYLERAIYWCPNCGFSHLESNGALFTCHGCGLSVRYGEDTALVGVDAPAPFRYVADWYDAQSRAILALDLAPYHAAPLFCDTVGLYHTEIYKKRTCVAEDVGFAAYDDRFAFTLGGEILTLMFADILAVTVLGRNKLNIYHGGKVYQVKAGERFCALKYMNLFYRQKEDSENGEFLGI